MSPARKLSFSSPNGNGWWEWMSGMPGVLVSSLKTSLGHQYHLMNHLGWADGPWWHPAEPAPPTTDHTPHRSHEPKMRGVSDLQMFHSYHIWPSICSIIKLPSADKESTSVFWQKHWSLHWNSAVHLPNKKTQDSMTRLLKVNMCYASLRQGNKSEVN